MDAGFPRALEPAVLARDLDAFRYRRHGPAAAGTAVAVDLARTAAVDCAEGHAASPLAADRYLGSRERVAGAGRARRRRRRGAPPPRLGRE